MIKNKHLVNFTVGLAKVSGFVPGWLLFKPKVRLAPGAKRSLPKNCILMSNHMSLLDFALYLLVFPGRTIRFPMAEVLYNKGSAMAFLLDALGGIKVDRDGKDFGCVPDCLEGLDGGGTLGIFPQGRLPVKGKPFPFTVSTAFIATNTDVPIIPVYTGGNYGISRRSDVVIGAPIYVSEHLQPGLSRDEQLQRLTDMLEKAVYDLKSYL